MKSMRHLPLVILLLCLAVTFPSAMSQSAGNGKTRQVQLDAYWAKVSRSVREGDFEGYKSTCHTDGVLVSGANKSSVPLSMALVRWKQGFLDTREGKIKADVEFRFSHRFGDESTAHETGIFLYSTVDSGGQSKQEYIHFQALLVKRKGEWKIMMEYQKSKATRAEWEALAAK